MTRTLIAALAAPLALLATASAADAHVVLTQTEAAPGSYFATALRIGHGCDGSATTRLRVEIPAEVPQARPQPKPGWALEIVREGDGPKARVSALVWRGRLPDEQFDEFGLLMKLPDRAGVLHFKVIQTCETGEAQWTEVPGAGDPPGALTHPAPTLTLVPAAGSVGEDAHHHH